MQRYMSMNKKQPACRRLFLLFAHIHFVCSSFGELVEKVDCIHFFRSVAHKHIDIVLRYRQTAVTQYLLERNNVAAVQNPLLGESVSVSVNACCFNASVFVVCVKLMIACTLGQLVAEHVAKQKVIW